MKTGIVYGKISQKNRNLRKSTKMLIRIFLKDEIMGDFYGDGNEEKRKNLRRYCTYYVLS